MLIDFLKFDLARRIYNEKLNDPNFNKNFWNGVLKYLNITYQCEGQNYVPKQGPCLVVCNHPFGLLDGLIILSLVSKVRSDYKILINAEVRNELKTIEKYLLPISFDLTRDAILENINTKKKSIQHLTDHGILIVFPSGEVATSKMLVDEATEREWKPLIGAIYKKKPCKILPVYFYGKNSFFFQFIGLLNNKAKKLLLLRELFNKKNKRIKLNIYKTFELKNLEKFTNKELIALIKKKINSLKNH